MLATNYFAIRKLVKIIVFPGSNYLIKKAAHIAFTQGFIQEFINLLTNVEESFQSLFILNLDINSINANPVPNIPKTITILIIYCLILLQFD